MDSTAAFFGKTIKQSDLDNLFLTVPGETIVAATLSQMNLAQANAKPNGAQVFPFQVLFGPYTPGTELQRWADYERMDWSIRQLPAINVFEGETEDKTSDEGWLNGTIKFQAIWPPNQRRSDIARVTQAFKGILQNFFNSDYARVMLDELYYIQRNNKVPALNEYGKVMTWSPNVQALIETELCPVTIVDVKYRLDLRSWNRALHYMNRTKAQPFQTPLVDLLGFDLTINGVVDTNDPATVAVSVKESINVSNP
jgi:hypothetical protein